jgi:hypothetical protein
MIPFEFTTPKPPVLAQKSTGCDPVRRSVRRLYAAAAARIAREMSSIRPWVVPWLLEQRLVLFRHGDSAAILRGPYRKEVATQVSH